MHKLRLKKIKINELVSLAEHIPFLFAWIIASSIVILMIVTYMGYIVRKWKYILSLLLAMIATYTIMYSLLNMEDYALLIGTFLLLALMVVAMYLTKKIHRGKSV